MYISDDEMIVPINNKNKDYNKNINLRQNKKTKSLRNRRLIY